MYGIVRYNNTERQIVAGAYINYESLDADAAAVAQEEENQQPQLLQRLHPNLVYSALPLMDSWISSNKMCAPFNSVLEEMAALRLQQDVLHVTTCARSNGIFGIVMDLYCKLILSSYSSFRDA